MTVVETIQAEIESLSSEEFARLREWFVERDGESWDKQMELANKTLPIWSPHDSFQGAATLLTVLNDDKIGY